MILLYLCHYVMLAFTITMFSLVTTVAVWQKLHKVTLINVLSSPLFPSFIGFYDYYVILLWSLSFWNASKHISKSDVWHTYFPILSTAAKIPSSLEKKSFVLFIITNTVFCLDFHHPLPTVSMWASLFFSSTLCAPNLFNSNCFVFLISPCLSVSALLFWKS